MILRDKKLNKTPPIVLQKKLERYTKKPEPLKYKL